MNKMVNKHTADYHPIPSESTSRIHPLIFLWTLRVFSLTNISWIFCQTCISHHACRNFWIYGIILLLENKFVSQKIEFLHFYSYPQAFCPQDFITTTLGRRNTFPLNTAFWKSIFPQQKGGIMELKKWPKLNLRRYWSQVLINFTIFVTITFLVFVSLCHSLYSF